MFYKNMADWVLHSGTFLHILVSFEKENVYPHYKGIFAPKKETDVTLKNIYLLQLLNEWFVDYILIRTLIIKLINWCNNLM